MEQSSSKIEDDSNPSMKMSEQEMQNMSDMSDMQMKSPDTKIQNQGTSTESTKGIKIPDSEPCSMKNMDMSNMMDMPNMQMKTRPHWQSVTLSALHCGAGCTLADIIGESISYYHPIHIVSNSLVSGWIFDFIIALVIGVFFQFFAIREMEKISLFKGLKRAFKADFFSLLSWQVGMYVWMSLVYFVFYKGIILHKDSFSFAFMMQIAMLVGFFFAYPMNALLIKLGIKKGM